MADYRMICEPDDKAAAVAVLAVGRRAAIYD
jgi:mRNA-degrading endonuclease RelE of RelBE toxin-antitoxin system